LKDRLYREVQIFFMALTFLTRIPAPTWVSYSESALNQAPRYFPLIGAIVGGIGATVFWLAHLIWPVSIAVLVSMLVTIMITGAFHEDGLADTCDAFGGGWRKEQALEIMKDSRLGTFGVSGLILILALKYLALVNTPTSLIPLVLIAGHSLSRFVAITFLVTDAYVRSDAARTSARGKSGAVAQKMSPGSLLVAALLGLLPLTLFNPRVWLALIPVFLIRWGMGRYFRKRIGGYTGDCLGATQQITEVTFYLFALI